MRRLITSSSSAKARDACDSAANATRSSCPTPAFSAATTSSNGFEVVTLNRSTSIRLVDIRFSHSDRQFASLVSGSGVHGLQAHAAPLPSCRWIGRAAHAEQERSTATASALLPLARSTVWESSDVLL